jgi:recombination protein RecT
MSNQITNTKTQELKALLTGDRMREQFAAALPKHLTPERFCRVAITALSRTPKLADCTQESFFRCLLDLSAFGLEPDGRRAHLIPYGNQCTLILDWKGLAELAMRSGIIAKLHADIVCENDLFDYDLGEIRAHKIDFRQPRGEMYAAYAMAVTKDGPVFVAVLNRDEIEGIRKRSRAGSSGPWVTDFNEMAKKTAFRRLAKWLPLSAEFRDALDKDDDIMPTVEREPIKGARAEPLNPFAGLPTTPAAEESAPVVEAEVIDQPVEDHLDDPALLDFLDQIQGCEDGSALTQLVKPANDGFDGAKQEIAKRAIATKAKELGVKWNKGKGVFEA